jgi:hypothetical protein
MTPEGREPDCPVPALSGSAGDLPTEAAPVAGQPAIFFGDTTGETLFPFLAPPLHPGDLGRLGRFRVLSVLGQGGMGIVFRGVDLDLERPVALKVMAPERAADPGSRQRFLREGRAAAAVSHDHVIPIFQVGEDNGVPFLAMALLQGESLEARLARPPAPDLDEALRIVRQVALGLAAAHARGLIHRDVKPDNIWLESAESAPRVRLLDFGLARPDNALALTGRGVFLGTPGYQAPDLTERGAADARSDLFSLGVVMYRLLTGQRPFRVESLLGYLSSIANDRPVPPHRINAAVPSGVSALTLRLLDPDPERRPATAAQFLEELDRACAPPARRRARPFLVGLLASAVTTAVVASLLLVRAALQDRPARSSDTEEQRRVGPGEVLTLIARDLESAAAEDRPYRRYLTLAHLTNQPGADDPGSEYAWVCRLLRRLGRAAGQQQEPLFVALADRPVVFRVDLRRLGWSEDDWEDLLRRYPYGLDRTEASDPAVCRKARRIGDICPGQLVHEVRADWFLFAVVDRPRTAPLPLTRDTEVRRFVRSYASQSLSVQQAAVELGLDDPALLCELLRKNGEWTKRAGLSPLLQGRSVPRAVWETLADAVSPYQDLSRQLGHGTPAR